MADIFLIVVSVVIGVLLIGVNFYILALYCHRKYHTIKLADDNGFGASLFCKILVILGFTMAWGQTLLISADISSSKLSLDNDIMVTIWYIFYLSILVMIGFMIPVAQFYYETDPDKTFMKRICEVACFEFIVLAVLTILLLCGYTFMNTANIPVKTVSVPWTSATQTGGAISTTAQTNSNTVISIAVSFPIFSMGFLAFIGWFLLVLFGGVGLSALPMDMINEWRNRPKMIKSDEAAKKKSYLKNQASQLILLGEQIKEQEKELTLVNGFMSRRKLKGTLTTQAKKFEAAVLKLEEEHEIFKQELDYMNVNPVVYWLKLFIGCFFIIISILWWFQILLYMCIKPNGFPVTTFLNAIFTYLDTTIMSFLGTIVLAGFSLYLLACTQKGNIKFGVRIPFLFTIHPMKVNETWMNSFLFNVNMILITSVAVSQFVVKAFSQYTSGSEIALMFSGQIQYLMFFNWFFNNNVFEITLLTWSGLVMVFLIVRPPPKSQILIDLEKRMNTTSDIELQSK